MFGLSVIITAAFVKDSTLFPHKEREMRIPLAWKSCIQTDPPLSIQTLKMIEGLEPMRSKIYCICSLYKYNDALESDKIKLIVKQHVININCANDGKINLSSELWLYIN